MEKKREEPAAHSCTVEGWWNAHWGKESTTGKVARGEGIVRPDGSEGGVGSLHKGERFQRVGRTDAECGSQAGVSSEKMLVGRGIREGGGAE